MNVSLNRLIEKHLVTLQRDGGKLVRIMERDEPNFEAARLLAHTLKGASGSLGFRAYSTACMEIELQCQAYLAGVEFKPACNWEWQKRALTEITAEDSALYKEDVA